jgi:isopentenyl-diphosphate delta-isomerase
MTDIDAREYVILVDADDSPIGVAAKLAAHQDPPQLHRAFSVFIFDSAGRMLLQRRASKKYHFGGLWTNACCSHPQPGEDTLTAASRRLRAELGIDALLEERFAFVYRAEDPSTGLIEWEFDHVFAGTFDGDPVPDADEVDEWRWVDRSDLEREVREHASRFTPWFLIALAKIVAQ